MFRCDRQAECQVDRSEALRYLGYADQQLTAGLGELIDCMLARCEELSQASWCYRVFPVMSCGSEAVLQGSTLRIPAQGVYSHMCACAVMACTIGLAHDREARRLAVGHATEALVFDAAGSALVESCADACERAVYEWALEEGLHAGQRMSPGYGNLPLGLSGDIIRALDAGKMLGISLLDSGLLVPMKSITALVALFEDEQDARLAHRSCADCIVRANCSYLQAGRPCNREG